MRPVEDPNHEGNSAKYHTGKPCIETGCTEPAGTWWGKAWCRAHNVQRLDRIKASLDGIIAKNEFEGAVAKAVAEWRTMLERALAENRALIAAHGGCVTLTDAHYAAETESESVQYRKNRPHVIRYTYKR